MHSLVSSKRETGREIFTARGYLGSWGRDVLEHVKIEAHQLFLGRNIRFSWKETSLSAPQPAERHGAGTGGREKCKERVKIVLPLFENVWLFLCCSTCFKSLCIFPDGKNDGVRPESQTQPSWNTKRERTENGLSVLLCPCSCRNPGWTPQTVWSTALSWARCVGLSSAGENRLVLALSLCFPLHLPAVHVPFSNRTFTGLGLCSKISSKYPQLWVTASDIPPDSQFWFSKV